jgi:dipeptidyl-peptidase III
MRSMMKTSLGNAEANSCRCNQPENIASITDGGILHTEAERFSEYRILRFQLPGFDSLSLEQKKMIYFLSEAAACGRDILFDQNFKHNLSIRRTLEAIYIHYKGDRTSPDFAELELYLKKLWFASGIHHHYSMDKFEPGFSMEFFAGAAAACPAQSLPLMEAESPGALSARLSEIIFNPAIAPKRVSLEGTDLISASANNYYEGLTQAEADGYYTMLREAAGQKPVAFGLNSKLVKENGIVAEQVYSINGMYGKAIAEICHWLDKAEPLAETSAQKQSIRSLAEYYKTGDLHFFDQYNIHWVADTSSRVDFVSGFIEVYGDPLGIKGSWESLVNYKHIEASYRTEIISRNAQWFEDNSPIDSDYKKEKVQGVSAKVIIAAYLAGDCYPATPIGVNLPNSGWIRKEHGSKSVTIENIMQAYDLASQGSGLLEEFCYSPEELHRAKQYGFLGNNLHTDLHECLGHGSGQSRQGVRDEDLKNYYSTIEETRADLFALYFIADPKLEELGLVPCGDVAKSEYDAYIRNGLMLQLRRIDLGKNIEESHMRNRQLIASWVLEQTAECRSIEKVHKNGKTYFIIKDYQRLRELFGKLLAQVQRIKSEGDIDAARQLIERHAVKVDSQIHAEVLARFDKLGIPPYNGFLNPVFVPVYDNGQITDVLIGKQEAYAEQMLRYSARYSFLPSYN